MWILWLKALHVAAMVAWFAGIFYLPRLFVYHAMCEPDDERGHARFHIMERKLLRGIMTPSAIVTLALGIAMIVEYGGMSYLANNAWLHAKLFLVFLLLIYHGWCYRWLALFRDGKNQRSHRFYRVINEVPVLILLGVVILVIVKPF